MKRLTKPKGVILVVSGNLMKVEREAKEACDRERTAWVQAVIEANKASDFTVIACQQAEEAMRTIDHYPGLVNLIITSDRPMPPGIGSGFLVRQAKNLVASRQVGKPIPVLLICDGPQVDTIIAGLCDKVLMSETADHETLVKAIAEILSKPAEVPAQV